MIFPTKKVAKYRCNSLNFAIFFGFSISRGGGQGPLAHPLDTRLLFRQKLNDDNELLQNKAAKAEESGEKLKQFTQQVITIRGS